MFLYEEQRKSSAVAVLLSILIPGVGNIYADHVVGAIITWALIVGGVAVVGNSVHNTTDGYSYPNTTNVNSSELTLGIFMILGGFVVPLACSSSVIAHPVCSRPRAAAGSDEYPTGRPLPITR